MVSKKTLISSHPLTPVLCHRGVLMEESAIRVYHHYLSSAKYKSVEMLHPVHVFFLCYQFRIFFFFLLSSSPFTFNCSWRMTLRRVSCHVACLNQASFRYFTTEKIWFLMACKKTLNNTVSTMFT